MTIEDPDPVLAALSALTPPVPSGAGAIRIRARCHAAMASQARPRRSWAGRLVDAGLAAGLALYGVSTVLEALRIISFSLE